MSIPRLLPIVVAGFVGILGGAASAQSTNEPPAEVRPPPMAEIVFFVAQGDANACGRGCNAWIAADGKIDPGAASRLRKLLAKLGRRRLPIFFHSPGGAVTGSIELGRLIRDQKMEVSVARTVPRGCDRDKPLEASCVALKRSGQELEAEFDPSVAMCNSGCVLALAGGAARFVPPWVKLGIHSVGIDPAKAPARGGAALTEAKRVANSRILEYLRDMGIDKALFTVSAAVPNESIRFLQRDELVRFGIDTREFGETAWRFADKPMVAMAKSFFVHTDNEQLPYRNAFVRLSCGTGKALRLTFARERAASAPIGAGLRPLRISVNGLRVDLPYAAASGDIDIRSAPLLANLFESVDDNGTIEVSGDGPGRNNGPPGAVTLNMERFSAAYAKLRKTCDDSARDNSCGVGDFSPRCTPEALKTWPPTPAAVGGRPAWPLP